MFDLEELKTKVVSLLVSRFEFSGEEATDAVDKSVEEHPAIWHENSDANDLAYSLATGDVD